MMEDEDDADGIDSRPEDPLVDTAAPIGSFQSSIELDYVLKRVGKESGDEKSRVVLLGVIQDEWEQLLGYDQPFTGLVRLVKVLERVLSENGNFLVKGHVLVTLTTLFLEMDVIANPMCRYLFQDLVALLWAYASKPNQRPTAFLRQMACECLREVETAYPCILGNLVSDILDPQTEIWEGSCLFPFSLLHCARLETSFMRRSYLHLIGTILDHMVHCENSEAVEQQHDAVDLLTHDAEDEENDYLLRLRPKLPQPSNMNLRPRFDLKLRPGNSSGRSFPANMFALVGSSKSKTINQSNKGKITEVVSLLLESIPFVSKWTRVYILMKVISMHEVLCLPQAMLKHRLWTFLCRSSAFVIHAGVLAHMFALELHDHPDHVLYLDQILSMIGTGMFPVEIRTLGCEWVIYLASKREDSMMGRETLMSSHAFLYPEVTDALQVKFNRYRALLHCLSDEPFNHEEASFFIYLIQSRIVYFNCERSVSIYGLVATFALLRNLFSHFPRMTLYVADYICTLMFEHCHVAHQDTKLLFEETFLMRAKFDKSDVFQSVVIRRLGTALASITNPERLEYYLPLLLFLAKLKSQDQNLTTCLALYRYVRVGEACTRGDWDVGMNILRCFETIVVHNYEPNRDRNSLQYMRRALQLMVRGYREPLVRERAKELLEILSLERKQDIEFFLTNERQDFRGMTSQDFAPQISQVMFSIQDLDRYLQLKRLPAILPSTDQHRCEVIEIPIEITLKDPLLLDNGEEYSRIMGLVLDFSPSQWYQEIEPVRIAYLGIASTFRLALSFRPYVPIPEQFTIRARFSVENGTILEGPLGSLHVNTEDLFLPLPRPDQPFWKEKCIYPSVRCIYEPFEKVLERIKVCFSPYHLTLLEPHDEHEGQVVEKHNHHREESWYSSTTEKQQQEEETTRYARYRVGFSIPPNHAILLEFHISAKSTLIQIRTDRWQLLSQLDAYISNQLQQ